MPPFSSITIVLHCCNSSYSLFLFLFHHFLFCYSLRSASIQACEHQLLQFRGLSGSLLRWLQTAQDQLQAKEGSLTTEGLQRRVQQLKVVCVCVCTCSKILYYGTMIVLTKIKVQRCVCLCAGMYIWYNSSLTLLCPQDLLNDWESQGSRVQELNRTGSELESVIINITAPQNKTGNKKNTVKNIHSTTVTKQKSLTHRH